MLTAGDSLRVWETVDIGPATCDLHHTHQRAQTVRRIELTIVETRLVRQLWAERWSRKSLPLVPAFRAVDAAGEEWTRDWDGWNGERPGDWRNGDRRAEPGNPKTYAPYGTSDGWVLVSDRAHQ